MWAGSVMTHHSSSCQWNSDLFMKNRSSLRQVYGNTLYVSQNESLCVHLPLLSVSRDCHLPILYLSSHTHTHPGSLVAFSSAHTGTQTNTTISHTPTHPEMLEILSRGDNMFTSQSLTRSPALSAWLKLTHSSVHAQSWLKWHFSFFTFTFIFTFRYILCFSDICLILKPLSDRGAK